MKKHGTTINIELWENLTVEQQEAMEKGWEEEGRKVTEDRRRSYFAGQAMLREIAGLPKIEHPGVKPEEKTPQGLPQKQGYYMWYILDLNYLDIGVVHITKDPEKHLEYLREQKENGSKILLYQNKDGDTLTMYHQTHMPPISEDGMPYVDGYVPFCFDSLR